MNGRRLVAAALLLALAQIGFLAWMIAGRAAILRDGREVLLRIEPVDPRDLLRGDYVRLNYEIADVPVRMLVDATDEEPASGQNTVFVRLGKDEDGFWRPRSARLGRPFAEAAPPGEVDIRGEAVSGRPSGAEGSLSVQYGIDRYYVPEGEGRAIEAAIGERSFAILAAIGADGTPQVKALMDGDERLYEEPLY